MTSCYLEVWREARCLPTSIYIYRKCLPAVKRRGSLSLSPGLQRPELELQLDTHTPTVCPQSWPIPQLLRLEVLHPVQRRPGPQLPAGILAEPSLMLHRRTVSLPVRDGWNASCWHSFSSPHPAGFPEGKHSCSPEHRGGRSSWSRTGCSPVREKRAGTWRASAMLLPGKPLTRKGKMPTFLGVTPTTSACQLQPKSKEWHLRPIRGQLQPTHLSC